MAPYFISQFLISARRISGPAWHYSYRDSCCCWNSHSNHRHHFPVNAVVTSPDSSDQIRGWRILLTGVQLPQAGIDVWKERAHYISMGRTFQPGSVTEIGSVPVNRACITSGTQHGLKDAGPEIIQDYRNGNSYCYRTWKNLRTSDKFWKTGIHGRGSWTLPASGILFGLVAGYLPPSFWLIMKHWNITLKPKTSTIADSQPKKKH